jgi:uncharacterized protein DUF6152
MLASQGRIFRFAVVTACVGLAASTAAAHHSAATFDLEKQVAYSGVVERFEWTNPHIHIYFRVDGEDSIYVAEGSSPLVLRLKGWSAKSLSPGDRVKIKGHPAFHPEERALWVNSVTVGDGRVLEEIETSHSNGPKP